MPIREQIMKEIKEKYKSRLRETGSELTEAPEQNGSPVKAVSQEVQRAVSCIHKHLYDQRLTVAWLKEQAHLNRTNFSGRFKYYVGETPRNYWVKHRIETAKILLKDEALAAVPVSTIAFNVGYNSPQAFSTTFKKYTRYSPKTFRDSDICPSEEEYGKN